MSASCRGWFIKNATGILWYSSNKIAHRVKTQARSQNNRSRALKWGIVCLYSWSSFEDTTKCMKIWVLQFFHFCKKVKKSLCKIKKLRKLWIQFLVITLKPFKLQWCTIPHFKALNLLFWPLAWLLTLGSIIFALWHKTFVYFFFAHPLFIYYSSSNL